MGHKLVGWKPLMDGYFVFLLVLIFIRNGFICSILVFCIN